jgi:hypothetical protein
VTGMFLGPVDHDPDHPDQLVPMGNPPIETGTVEVRSCVCVCVCVSEAWVGTINVSALSPTPLPRRQTIHNMIQSRAVGKLFVVPAGALPVLVLERLYWPA